MRANLTILLSLALVISCSAPDNEQSQEIKAVEKAISLSLVDKGIKTFKLDSLADFERLGSLQINNIKDVEGFSFYDFPTNSLYIHNYESGELIKKITLEKQGPNKVPFLFDLQYYLHSLDSIYVNTTHYGYFLINSQAQVFSSLKTQDSGFSSNKIRIIFDESSFLSGSKVHGTLRSAPYKAADHFPFVRGTIDFETGELQMDSIHAKSIFDDYDGIIDILSQAQKKGKLHVSIRRQIMKSKSAIYAATAISDTIRVFKNQQLVESIYAGLPEHEVIDYLAYFKNNEIIQGKGSVSKKQVLNQPPVYKYTKIDPKGEFIYRVVSHGTKSGISPYNGEEIPVIYGTTLLAIDLKTKERYAYELPIEEIDLENWGKPFVSSAGIHFRVKDQENEDQVQFRVFGIADSNSPLYTAN